MSGDRSFLMMYVNETRNQAGWLAARCVGEELRVLDNTGTRDVLGRDKARRFVWKVVPEESLFAITVANEGPGSTTGTWRVRYVFE